MRRTAALELHRRCAYKDYYLRQAQTGSGITRVYVGNPYQRGHGIGSILGRFARYVAPMLFNGAKFVGKKLLGTSTKILGDVVTGQDFKTAAKRRANETLDDVRKQYGSGVKRKRTKAKKKKASVTPSKTIKRIVKAKHKLVKAKTLTRTPRDIFEEQLKRHGRRR